MELYLVRHTTPAIKKGICYGQADIDVTANFLQEAQVILQQLTIDHNTKVYSSPLKRCKLLAEHFQKTVHYDRRLLELDFGTWELQPWNSIPKKELDPWMADYVNTCTNQGESYSQLQKRVLDFFYSIPHQPNSTTIVVTHAGVIRALLAHLLHRSLQDSFDIQVHYGHVIKMRYHAAGFKIIDGLVLK